AKKATTTDAGESLPSLTYGCLPDRPARETSRSGSKSSRGSWSEPQQGFVERADELGTVAVEQRLDERSSERVAHRTADTVGTQVLQDRGARLGFVADEHRRPHP